MFAGAQRSVLLRVRERGHAHAAAPPAGRAGHPPDQTPRPAPVAEAADTETRLLLAG